MAGIDQIPTRQMMQPLRHSMLKTQSRLSETQTEATTGRHFDIGLALGGRTGSTVNLRLRLASIDQALDDFKQAEAKSDLAQASLSSLSQLADEFRATLTGARTSDDGRTIAAGAASTALLSFRDILSASYDGQYLFSGLNTGTAPLNDYGSGPRQAVISAFETEFGFSPSDPAAANLTPVQISDFINGTMEDIFSDSGWRSTWSNASDEAPTVRMNGTQTISVQTTTNGSFAQKIAKALTVMEFFGNSRINDAALESASDTALALVSEGQLEVGNEQAMIGFGHNALKLTQSDLAQRRVTLTGSIQGLEGVDPYEAATNTNLLMSQLEASYALTARLSRLTLLSYI